MPKSIAGIYREGKVDLLEPAPSNAGSKVIVTFVDENNSIDLASRGISEADAAKLRSRLKSFAEDWSAPEMDIYDEK